MLTSTSGNINIRLSRFPHETTVPYGPAIAPARALMQRDRQIGTFGMLYQITSADELTIFNSLPLSYIRTTRKVMLSIPDPKAPIYRAQALFHFNPLYTASPHINRWRGAEDKWRSGLMQLRVIGTPEWYIRGVYYHIWGRLENFEPLFFPPLKRCNTTPPHIPQEMRKQALKEAAHVGDAQILSQLTVIAGHSRAAPGVLSSLPPQYSNPYAPHTSSPLTPGTAKILPAGSSSPLAPIISSPLTPYSISRGTHGTKKRKAGANDGEMDETVKRRRMADAIMRI
jgi:hypothetical protein